MKSLTSSLRDICSEESIPLSRDESLIVPVFKRGTPRDCGSYCEINLISIVDELLASKMLSRLTLVCESKVRKQ